jgi:endonuclease/exonuclease/phosphatase family metal-dependent hydrolase
MFSAQSQICVVILLAAGAHAAGTPQAWMADQGPELLNYTELVTLSESASLDIKMEEKLQDVLAVPLVSNAAARSGAQPKRPAVEGLGSVLRVAQWNLESSYNLEHIRVALNQPAEFLRQATNAKELPVADRQGKMLSEADVLLLNEVDLGVSRSNYRDVAAELAMELNMNYAFGVEFVEVDPLLLGLERPHGDEESVRTWMAEHPLNKEHFRGLHGNAVLSRYPILSARVVRLPECYDWYGREKQSVAQLEKGRRWTARRVFEERISRQIRRGGRIALVVELSVPDAPGEAVTVVSTHLENRCRPACRQDQMDVVMDAVAHVPHAVVIGGDLNTTGTNAVPTSIRRELTGRATSLKFWLGMAVRYLSPVSIPQVGLIPANHFKNFLDPSVFHLALFLPNRERGLFTKVQKFRFHDGGAFDFSGSSERTQERRGKTLANSNQRHFKGFKPTFAFERTFRGLVGRYKLDWFFVRPGADGRLAPHAPVTMNELNEVTGRRMSDHPPMTVDLPLTVLHSSAPAPARQ